jgi:hypothetical protein
MYVVWAGDGRGQGGQGISGPWKILVYDIKDIAKPNISYGQRSGLPSLQQLMFYRTEASSSPLHSSCFQLTIVPSLHNLPAWGGGHCFEWLKVIQIILKEGKATRRKSRKESNKNSSGTAGVIPSSLAIGQTLSRPVLCLPFYCMTTVCRLSF